MRWEKINNRYVYKVIKNLCGQYNIVLYTYRILWDYIITSVCVSIILGYCYLSQQPLRNTSVKMGTPIVCVIVLPCRLYIIIPVRGEYNIEKRKINRSKVLLEHCSSHAGTWPVPGPRRYNIIIIIIVLYNDKTPKSSRRRYACTCTYIL